MRLQNVIRDGIGDDTRDSARRERSVVLRHVLRQPLHINRAVADYTGVVLAIRRTVLQLRLINLILQHNYSQAPTDFPFRGRTLLIYIYSPESR